jgi:hypothetical protein
VLYPVPEDGIVERVFDHWEGISREDICQNATVTEDEIPTMNPLRLTMNSNKRVRAVFKGLSLHLEKNPISNISPLQNLKQITTLDLGGSKAAITSLLPLAPLKNLTHLALWDLSLDDADLVAGDGSNILSNLKYLTHLDLSSTTKNGDKCNNISSIDWLPNIPHITSLYMQNNKVMSLGALDGLFDLESLYFTGNDIIDLSPLVANLAGVNDGDVLLIDKNPNLSVESVCEYIPTLKDRNVLVTSDLSCDQMGQVYELNIAVRGDGTTSPPPGRLSFREGSRITIEAKEGAGATFVAWEGDTASATIDPADPKKITVAMNGNRDITAVFADPNNKFTLTTYVTGPANSGTVTPAPGTAYEHYENQSVEVTAVPATGFELDPDTGWTIDPPDGVVLTSPLPSKIKIPMTVNREVTVKFREKTKSYTLTILEPTPAGSGLVYPEPSVRAYPYENGQPQTASVRATVERGYEFDYWEGDVAADYRRSPTLNIVMDANKRIRPVFQKDVFDYTLEVNMTGNGRVAASDQWTCIEDNQALPPTPPCYKRYYKGDVVGLTAESSENWVFGFWAGDVPDQLKRNNPISITMDRGRSVTAVFVEAESRTFRTAVTGEGRVDTNPWRDPAIYPVNESVALIATPSAGWEFSAWVIGEGEAAASVGNTNPYFLSLSPDRDNVLATAVFVPLRAAAGITPNTGSILGGETVVITGTGLGSAISVKFGSKTGQLVSVSDTEIKVITPAYIPGVTSVYIDLGVKQIELTDAFRFEIKAQQVLSIMNVTPSSGIVYGGETVYIAGTGFEAPATVKFGETEVPAVDVIGVTETEIRVKSPTHAPGSVAITVTTPKGTVSVANAFTYWTPSLSNAIQCIVADATSGDTIETATVELVPDGRTVSNAKGGIYVIPNVTPGEYTVRVTAPGYPLTEQKVTVGPSEWKNVLVPLVSNADQSSTVECTVKSRLLGDSVSGATVEFFPGKGTFTESADTKGLYVLTGATAGQYTLRVRKDVFDEYIDILIEAGKNYKITAYIGVGLFGLGAQGVEVVDEQTLVKPNLCAAAVTVDSTAKVYDLTVPASLDVSPQEAVASGASLAIRVRSDEPVAPASVKAAVLAADGYHEEGGVWSAVEGSGDTDGWVVFTPESAYPAGAIIYAVANASTVSGVAIEPVLARFQVAASDGGAKSLDALGEISDVVGVVAPLAAPASSVYRLGPDALFAAPQLVQIPLAAGVDPALVGLYYRWTGEDGPAWVDATSVQGWLVPGSVEVVTADGQSWLQFEANYGAVVQAGVTLKINAGAAGTLEISAGGGHGSWLALGAILSLLALALVRIVTTTRSTARGVVRS